MTAGADIRDRFMGKKPATVQTQVVQSDTLVPILVHYPPPAQVVVTHSTSTPNWFDQSGITIPSTTILTATDIEVEPENSSGEHAEKSVDKSPRIRKLLSQYEAVRNEKAKVLIPDEFNNELLEIITSNMLQESAEDINASDEHHNTLLHYACRHGHVEIVKILLEAGGDHTKRDEHLNMPIHIACQGNHLEVLKVLFEYKAQVDEAGSKLRSPLSIASERGQEAVALILLEHGANPNKFDEFLKTPLHYAAEFGHMNLVNLLTERYASHSNFLKIRTPLHWAALSGQAEAVRALVADGRDVDALDANDDSPLILASIASQLETVHVLIEECKAQIDIVNVNAKTALHYMHDEPTYELLAKPLVERMLQAVRDASVPDITLLLNLGVRVDCRDELQNTPLHIAVSSAKKLEAVVELLMTSGADPNAINTAGVHALGDANNQLFYAAKYGLYERVKEIILRNGRGLNLNMLIDDMFGPPAQKQTALAAAALRGHADVVRILLQARASGALPSSS
eukprot:gene41656-51612_t